jgi:multidrug efflux pump subunit AcrA (membrane-fusion protein)
MKKTIAVILVLGLVGWGYWTIRTHPIDIAALAGKKMIVRRGDLTIPINASGDVKPSRRVEIKANASGEVIEITKKAGQRIAADETLILLKQEDEQRNVDRAQADVKRAVAALERARQTLVDRKGPSLEAAQARVAQIKPRLEYMEWDLKRRQEFMEANAGMQAEIRQAEANVGELQAQLASADAELSAARIAIGLAEQDVVTADANRDNAVAALGVAEKQLRDTRVISPIDGMVSAMNVHVGEVIQGGKTTITGGTLLAKVAEVDKIYVETEVDEADIGVVRELAPESARPQLGDGSDSSSTPSSEPSPGSGDGNDAPIASGSKVKITVEAFHDEDFAGLIERIYPEPKSAASSVVTYLVDVLITSPNRDKLMLGMHADVEFTAKSVYNAILVSRDAIKRGPNGKDLGVFVPTVGPNGKPGEPQFVRCRFGLDNGLFAEVLEGLQDGDEVYTQVPGKTEREEEKEGSKK